MTKNWTLIKHQTNNAATDSTSINVLNEHDLEKGSKVKLIFNSHDTNTDTQHTEYLWVEIILVQGDMYLGQLLEKPNNINNLAMGDMIEFQEQHIFEYDYIDPFDPSIKV